MKKLIIPIAVLLLAFIAVQGVAQTEEQLLAQLLEDERTSVEALVLYPEKTRLAILEASKYPETLIKLESMQSRTSQAFQSLLQQYPQETQEAIYDLTRYPGLIARLANERSEAPDLILNDYPVEIHKRVKDAFYNHRYLLSDADRLQKEWNGAFENLLQDYPALVRDALRQLVELPEVLDILSDNIRMTVLVGDLYQRRPAWLLQQLDSLNLVVANERAKELNDWKNSLEQNPQAKQEFIASTEEFANEYGNDDSYYEYDDDLYFYEDAPEETVIEHHYYHHYPYWFGYPTWYVYPRWRPYPWWWDWGFYWGPNRMIVIVDMPSYYFTHWYFYRPYHHHHYPHLSAHFANHYYGHRTSSSSVTRTVINWREDNRNVVSESWLADARSRPDAFREFGKFEESRVNYNRKHADQPLTQREFLDKNSRKYPELSKEAARTQAPERRDRTTTEPPVQKRKTEPVVKPPSRKDPVTVPRTRTEPEIRQQPKANNQTPQKRQHVDIPKVDKARDYHKNTWEKSKIEQPRRQTTPSVRRQPAPKAKTQPAPKTKTAPRTTTKKKGGG